MRDCMSIVLIFVGSKSTASFLTLVDTKFLSGRVKQEMLRLLAKHPNGIDGFQEPVQDKIGPEQ